MFRYWVPVDDRWHEIGLTGDPVAVAAASSREVEFWAEYEDDGLMVDRQFRVYGTGHPLPRPEDARWVGTCPRLPNGLVWHLYERLQPDPVRAMHGRVVGVLDAAVTAQLEQKARS